MIDDDFIYILANHTQTLTSNLIRILDNLDEKDWSNLSKKSKLIINNFIKEYIRKTSQQGNKK